MVELMDGENKTNHQLALEIQELRQALLVVLNPFIDPIAGPQAKERWWTKLGLYPRVEP